MLAKRALSGRLEPVFIAPKACWARYVTTLSAAASIKNGNFSATISQEKWGSNFIRFNGQKSSNKNTNGSVTSTGLAISPQTKRKSVSAYKIRHLERCHASV